MNTKPSRWNAISGTAIILSLIWILTCVLSLWNGKAAFADVAAAVGPVIGYWTGLLTNLVKGD